MNFFPLLYMLVLYYFAINLVAKCSLNNFKEVLKIEFEFLNSELNSLADRIFESLFLKEEEEVWIDEHPIF